METTHHFKYCKIDPNNVTKEDLASEINRLTTLMNQKKNEEQAIKIFINSIYGATASPYFVGYNVRVAEAITLQGQEVRDYAGKIFNRYFMEFWHRDKELHEQIGITRAERVTQEVAIYGDTDSISSNSIIRTDQGTITVEELYNESQQSAGITVEGHESVISNRKILNWDSSLYFAEATRIIRHKVTKPRWRLKLKNGKSIDVTNDHSMIVFRDDKKISVTPSEILKSDKILCIAIDK